MKLASAVVLLAAAGLAPADPGPDAPPAAGPPPACNACAAEPRPATRKVYSCKCEEYCLPSCGLWSLLRGGCGCADGPCGELRVRHRLVVTKVPVGTVIQCVPQMVPAATPAAPAPKAPSPDVSGPAPTTR